MTVVERWKARRMSDEWYWCSEDETDNARDTDAIERAADREPFYARHDARAKARAEEPVDVERDHPRVADGVSYSLGDKEASRVLRQMRLEADAARRAHAPGADIDGDD